MNSFLQSTLLGPISLGKLNTIISFLISSIKVHLGLPSLRLSLLYQSDVLLWMLLSVANTRKVVTYLQMKQVKLKFIVLDHVAQHNNSNTNAFILNFWVWLHESFSSGC